MNMMKRMLKPAFSSIGLSLLLLLWLASQAAAQDQSFTVEARGPLLDVHASEAPLIDVVKAICEKTGMVLNTTDPMTEPVSLELKDIAVEKSLDQLLAHRNYMIIQKQGADGKAGPAVVYVIGSGASREIGAAAHPMPPHDPVIKIGRKTFAEKITASGQLHEQITAMTKLVEDGLDGRALLVTEVADQSFFDELGVKQGDTVVDINGKPVTTVEEFISILAAAAREESGNIRIARLKSGGLMEPIYINLH